MNKKIVKISHFSEEMQNFFTYILDSEVFYRIFQEF